MSERPPSRVLLADLQAARKELDAASERCPHWDFTSPNDFGNHECCAVLNDAAVKFREARAALQRSQMS